MAFLYSYTKIYPGLEFGNELITIYYKKVFCLSLGDMDMKKMNSPKLEVIQFNTEDVIVTSGGGASSITKGFLANNNYFTLGREIEQAQLATLSNREENYFYHFYAPSDGDSFLYSPNSCNHRIESYNDSNIKYYYTWYTHGTGWQTEMKTHDYYMDGNELTN